MFKYLILILWLTIQSCITNNSVERNHITAAMLKDTSKNELSLMLPYKAFDTSVEVIFTNSSEMSECQKEIYDGFMARQDSITSQIMDTVFQYYSRTYSFYKEGWTAAKGMTNQQLEEHLPVPTTPVDLRRFIKPVVVHIPSGSKCKAGSFGIEFECTWDLENGVGVIVQNWKVVNAGSADVAYQ